jgi:isopentenyl-diphosphate delta-isomerase
MGGTSFSAVEMYRAEDQGDDMHAEIGNTFFDWGIPAPVALQEAKAAKLPLIASGGVLDGAHVAAAIAMGATAAGAAKAVLKEATESAEAVKNKLLLIKEELKVAMMLTGSANIEQLSKARYVVLGETREWLEGLKWTQNSI